MSGPLASGGQSIGVFSFSISPSNEYSGLISFRIAWFDLLAVHRTLQSLLQHCSSKASVLLKKKGSLLLLVSAVAHASTLGVGGRRDRVSKDSGEHRQQLWRELLDGGDCLSEGSGEVWIIRG